MKQVSLKQIKDQDYREIEKRERERGTFFLQNEREKYFDSRYKKQTYSDKKNFPSNTKLVSLKRNKKKTYINIKICREREKGIHDLEMLREGKCWGKKKIP